MKKKINAPRKLMTVGEFRRCLEADTGKTIIRCKPTKDEDDYGKLEVRFFIYPKKKK